MISKLLGRAATAARFGVLKKNRFQTKILSSDVVSDGEITDLTFNNLVVGRKYRVNFQNKFFINNNSTSDFSVEVLIDNGSDRVGAAQLTGQTNSGANLEAQNSDDFVFTATDTTLTFTANSANSDERVRGDNTRRRTYAQLEELNNYEETTDLG